MDGLCVGLTVKSTQVLFEGSPATPFRVCELPSLPASLKLNGPRLGEPLTHALSVELLPQSGLQLAVQDSEAP